MRFLMDQRLEMVRSRLGRRPRAARRGGHSSPAGGARGAARGDRARPGRIGLRLGARVLHAAGSTRSATEQQAWPGQRAISPAAVASPKGFRGLEQRSAAPRYWIAARRDERHAQSEHRGLLALRRPAVLPFCRSTARPVRRAAWLAAIFGERGRYPQERASAARALEREPRARGDERQLSATPRPRTPMRVEPRAGRPGGAPRRAAPLPAREAEPALRRPAGSAYSDVDAQERIR